MKYKILEILKNEDDFISGEKISEIFGVSRAYIWKLINSLKEDGYIIESISNRGYRLLNSPDRISYEEISEYLHTKIIGRDMEYLETVDSTNNYAKSMAKDSMEGKIIVAEEQTKGKGRLGRDWQSEKYSGLYFSIILKPDILPRNISKLTLIGSSAVYLALKELNIDIKIKWPNDILLNGKKVCGILTELSGQIEKIDYIIMGIGINVNNEFKDFNEELHKKASSLKMELYKEIDRKLLLAKILNNFEELYNEFVNDNDFSRTLEIARENSILIGEEARIISGDVEEFVKVLDINEDGELLVERDGKIFTVYSGEVSLRGLEGYSN